MNFERTGTSGRERTVRTNSYVQDGVTAFPGRRDRQPASAAPEDVSIRVHVIPLAEERSA